MPLPLPPAFGTAQVIGQSARAAGAPRSEGGERGDLFHARINSRSGGGAAGAGPEPAQQPRVVATVRLDVRLPALNNKALEVPALRAALRTGCSTSTQPYQGVGRGVGRGGRPAAEPVSMAERLSKLHCGCCMKPLSEKTVKVFKALKAVNKGATYWVCGVCYDDLSGCGGEQVEEWLCPTAADGGDDCLCWCEPKQAPRWKKRRKSTFSSSKTRKLNRAQGRAERRCRR